MRGCGRFLGFAFAAKKATSTPMIRPLYNWMMRWSAHPRAGWALFWISFIESSVFPLPPDLMLVPMCLANRARAFQYAAICTAASALGGLFGYAIGYFLFETIGQWVIDFYGLQAAFDGFQAQFQYWGWWLVLGAGFTPLPYKLITIASGVFMLNIWVFIAASVISRGARFFLEAWLIRQFGAPIQGFIERYMGILTILFFICLFGGFLAVKYLV